MIAIEGLSKRYGAVRAVADVSLAIAAGEFFALLGASGCGKTTLLRLIAGLDRPDTGRVAIDGVDMTEAPPYERPVNTVFQSYALFPHMSVRANVAFGLKQEGIERAAIAVRVAEALRIVHLEGFDRRKPHELSGGQKQRVALARALVKRPKVVLLDEPMAALDKKLREKTRFELKSIQHEVGLSFIMVTHDQDEAMALSDRIAVMDAGRIVQVGSPRDIYDRPANAFIADFIGNANFFDAIVSATANGLLTLAAPEVERVLTAPAGTFRVGEQVRLMVRPEHLALGAERPNGNALRVRIEAIAFLGDASAVEVRTAAGRPLSVRTARRDLPPAGSETWVSWPAEAGIVLKS